MKSSLLKIHKIHYVMLSIKENKFIKKKSLSALTNISVN